MSRNVITSADDLGGGKSHYTDRTLYEQHFMNGYQFSSDM
jgi:hypothetical protein